jgi:cob(I)alamin adenosyltransferase
MNELGLIQVYTGNGKGKTTATLGLMLRAVGHGLKSSMIQFMKDEASYGETAVHQFLPDFEIIPVGRTGLINLKNPDLIDRELAEQGWNLAKKKISSGQYQLVVLDEINIALKFGLLSISEIVSFLSKKNNACEVVLTGRYAPPEVIELADLVTEMKDLKGDEL